MRRIVCSAAVLLLLAAGCTTVPKRAEPCDGRVEDCQAPEIRTSIDDIIKDEQHRNEVARSSFEHHPDFMVGFAEFDDQGWFHNHEQFERIKLELEDALTADGRKDPAIVVAFIHGWRHTADVCDRDVTCFREVLRGLAAYEKARAEACSATRAPGGDPRPCVRRKIAGVMIGWRGAPIAASPNPVWSVVEKGNVLSFYSRKSAAHTIGQSGFIATVLGYLNRLDRQLSEANPKSRLVLAGHSFGGGMLFSYAAGVLNQQIAEERYAPGRPELFDCATFKPDGIGDLVVLLNPAFEALRYFSIYDRTRDLRNCPPRRTIMMTLASETDIYNGFWFSVGRGLSTMLDRFGTNEQRWQSLRAVGHYRAFRTHELKPNTASELFEDRERLDRPRCACRYEANEDAMRTLAQAIYGQGPKGGPRAASVYAQMATKDSPCDTPSCLIPAEDGREPNNPFKVVRVHRDIIDGHSDIYNPRLLDFIVRTVAAGDAAR